MGWKAAYLRKPNRSDLKAHSHPPNLVEIPQLRMGAGAHAELLEQSLRVSDAPPRSCYKPYQRVNVLFMNYLL